MERKFDRAPYLNHWCDKYIAVLVINVWVNILDRASEEYTVFQREQTAIELRYKRQTICSSEITKIQKESRLCERGFAIEWICEVSCQTWFNHIQSDFSRCTSLVVKEGGKRKQTFAHVRRKSGHKEDTVFIGEYMSSRIILTASYWHDVKKMIFVIWNFITFILLR